MRKVLLIAYHFPPSGEVGSQRPLGLAKNLRRYGWEPIVLTTWHPGSSRSAYAPPFRVIETDPFDLFQAVRKVIPWMSSGPSDGIGAATGHRRSRLSRRLRHMFKAVFAFPDRHVGWYPIAIRAARKVMSAEKVDLILSTSSPWTSALVARRLRLEYNTPWIADFRDLWSQNHRREFGSIRTACDRALERRTLKRADRLVVVSAVRAEKWGRLHPRKTIHPITLGFDEDDFRTPGICDSTPTQFVICYAGKIKGQQDPIPLFQALSELKAEDAIPHGFLRVNFWGEVEPPHREAVKSLGLEDCVFFMPRIPREKILEEMRNASLLLNLNWNDPEETGVHHAKVFDYLGTMRPILSIGRQSDVVTELLAETHTGVQLWCREDIKSYLSEKMLEFRQTGRVRYEGLPEVVMRYGYAEITRKFADVMNEVIRAD